MRHDQTLCWVKHWIITIDKKYSYDCGVRQWSHSLMTPLHCLWAKSNAWSIFIIGRPKSGGGKILDADGQGVGWGSWKLDNFHGSNMCIVSNQKQSSGNVLKKRCSSKFSEIHKKAQALKTRFCWNCRSREFTFIKQEITEQMFSCEFCETSHNTF